MNELLNSRLELFPLTTLLAPTNTGLELQVAGTSLFELATQYGTPLYIFDRATLDAAVTSYRKALREYYPASSGITYAGKAYLSLAIVQWAQKQNLWLDCTGAGELAIAAAAGAARESILVHGVNKSAQDLQAAILLAGTIVVDNLSELERLAGLSSQIQALPELWLRLRPGFAVDTHAFTQTGQEGSKFGMEAGEIELAVRLCQANRLPLTGLHFHLGSHFHDPSPLKPAIEVALDLLANLGEQTGWFPSVFCTGGGWGIPYHEDDLPHPSLENYVRFIAENLVAGCQARQLPLPRLQIEPGRSLVARAGIAIYQVGAVKQNSKRRWLLLDGGLADNPRPALYGARYSALPVRDPQRPNLGPAWLAGPYCESSDILISGLRLPEIEAGEFIAIPVSGAYHLSMGSNYNGARKPAVIWLEQDNARLIQRRETLDDLYRRDLLLNHI